jgi:hypothetical protein
MTVFTLIAGAVMVLVATIEYNNAVNNCFATYYACDQHNK